MIKHLILLVGLLRKYVMISNEILWHPNENDLGYFKNQLKTPYESTKEIFNFLSSNINDLSCQKILDVGTGSGANTFFLNENYAVGEIVGVDLHKEYIDMAIKYKKKNIEKHKNVNFFVDDFINTNKKMSFDGIMSHQTISFVEDGMEMLMKILSQNVDWILLSSLFYDGLIEVESIIKIFQNCNQEDYKLKKYTTFSIPKIEALIKKYNYKNIKFKKFELKIDLTQKNINKMGTYTIKTEAGNLQLSGPILMNWYFVLIRK